MREIKVGDKVIFARDNYTYGSFTTSSEMKDFLDNGTVLLVERVEGVLVACTSNIRQWSFHYNKKDLDLVI